MRSMRFKDPARMAELLRGESNKHAAGHWAWEARVADRALHRATSVAVAAAMMIPGAQHVDTLFSTGFHAQEADTADVIVTDTKVYVPKSVSSAVTTVGGEPTSTITSIATLNQSGKPPISVDVNLSLYNLATSPNQLHFTSPQGTDSTAYVIGMTCAQAQTLDNDFQKNFNASLSPSFMSKACPPPSTEGLITSLLPLGAMYSNGTWNIVIGFNLIASVDLLLDTNNPKDSGVAVDVGLGGGLDIALPGRQLNVEGSAFEINAGASLNGTITAGLAGKSGSFAVSYWNSNTDSNTTAILNLTSQYAYFNYNIFNKTWTESSLSGTEVTAILKGDGINIDRTVTVPSAHFSCIVAPAALCGMPIPFMKAMSTHSSSGSAYEVTSGDVTKIDGRDAAPPGSLAVNTTGDKWFIMTPWRTLIRRNSSPFTGSTSLPTTTTTTAPTLPQTTSTTSTTTTTVELSMPANTNGHGSYVGSPQTVTAQNVGKVYGSNAAPIGSLAQETDTGWWVVVTPSDAVVYTKVDPFTGSTSLPTTTTTTAPTLPQTTSTTSTTTTTVELSMPANTNGHGSYVGSPQTVTAQNVGKVYGSNAAPIGSLAQETDTGWWVVVTPSDAVVYTKVDPFTGSTSLPTTTTTTTTAPTLPQTTSTTSTTTTLPSSPTTETLQGIVAPPSTTADTVVSVTYSYSDGKYTTILELVTPAVPLSQTQINQINSSNDATYQSALNTEQQLEGKGTGSISKPYTVPQGDIPALLPWYGSGFYQAPGYGEYYLPDANSVLNYNLAAQGEYSSENTAYVIFTSSGKVVYPAGYSGPTEG